MKVDVYKNLHRDCYSIRSREKESYGRVIDHSKNLILEDVQFVVNERGRLKVIQEKRKNVHAFARGKLVSTRIKRTPRNLIQIKYNPYKYGYFYRIDTLEPIKSATKVYCNSKGLWING